MCSFVQLIAFFVGIASAATYSGRLAVRQATNAPEPGTIIWICTSNTNPSLDIPEVCKNMCYGAYCRGYGTSLTWDNYAGGSQDRRVKNAGCDNNSHCATSPPGTGTYQCDAYPFSSTSEADRTDKSAVNRCVPSGQYNRQGARLHQLFNSNGPWKHSQGLNGQPPAAFHQTFSNSGELIYCSGHTGGDDCLNDGLEYDKHGIINDTISNCSDSAPRDHMQYRLRSGETITVPDHFQNGHRVWLPRAHNSTLLLEQSEIHAYDHARGLEQFDHMVGNLYMEEDFVETRLS